MPDSLAAPEADGGAAGAAGGLLAIEGIRQPVLYYFTPLALQFSDHVGASLVVYDCMDELSAFSGAPPEIAALEQALLARADLVFTGGVSLFEAKRHLHPNVHAFPSSVDVAHFARARALRSAPEDQATIPRPRLGFYGVIDERLDLELIDAVAADAAGLAAGHARSGGEDRPGRAAQARQHPLARAQAVRGAAALSGGLGRRAAAVRAQRCDPLHQPHQDAGVPGRRPPGRLDPDH